MQEPTVDASVPSHVSHERVKQALLIGSLMLNVILGTMAGTLWLQRRTTNPGLPPNDYARPSAGASVLPKASIEFRVAEEQPGTGLTAVRTGDYPPTLYVHPEVTLSNSDIRGATADRDEFGLPAVSLELAESGAKKLRAVTSANRHKRLAILVDGKVLVAPVIEGPVKEARVHLTGALEDADVQRIVLAFERR